MRHSMPFLFAASMLVTGFANAAPTQDADRSGVTVEQIEKVEGLYALSDGRRARIVAINERLFAEIGKHERHELFVVSPDTMVSRNGRVTLRASSADKEASLTLRPAAIRTLLSSR